MEFQLLAPFAAYHDGEPIDIGRRQERCLLAVLVLDAGRTVPTSRLIDIVWGDEPPSSARGTVQTYVGRLRATLGPLGVRISTYHDGYCLEADDHAIDAAEFSNIAHAAAGIRQPAERSRKLDDALAMWKGRFLEDLVDDETRHRLGGTLEELRLISYELRAESRLRLGKHDQVVADLTPLAAEHPARERLVALLMTALYRSGRQADALALFRATHEHLVADLGVEPGPELQLLHERILRADRSLESPEIPEYVVRIGDHTLPWNVGGHPALDFCNTFAGWSHDPPLPRSEWLRDYPTLATWTGYIGLINNNDVHHLHATARRDAEGAAEALGQARALRSRMYTCFTKPDDHQSFAAVARVAEAAACVTTLHRDESGLGRWEVSREAGLLLPVYAIARAAAELLCDARLFTIRACPRADCGWLFIDAVGKRRWCSASTCGAADLCA